MPKPVPVDSLVYVIRAADMVKIGTTTNLQQRLKAIQMHSAVQLELIGTIPGDHSREAAFHREFARYRQHGEWFKLPPEVVEALARRLCEPSVVEIPVEYSPPPRGGLYRRINGKTMRWDRRKSRWVAVSYGGGQRRKGKKKADGEAVRDAARHEEQLRLLEEKYRKH